MRILCKYIMDAHTLIIGCQSTSFSQIQASSRAMSLEDHSKFEARLTGMTNAMDIDAALLARTIKIYVKNPTAADTVLRLGISPRMIIAPAHLFYDSASRRALREVRDDHELWASIRAAWIMLLGISFVDRVKESCETLDKHLRAAIVVMEAIESDPEILDTVCFNRRTRAAAGPTATPPSMPRSTSDKPTAQNAAHGANIARTPAAIGPPIFTPSTLRGTSVPPTTTAGWPAPPKTPSVTHVVTVAPYTLASSAAPAVGGPAPPAVLSFAVHDAGKHNSEPARVVDAPAVSGPAPPALPPSAPAPAALPPHVVSTSVDSGPAQPKQPVLPPRTARGARAKPRRKHRARAPAPRRENTRCYYRTHYDAHGDLAHDPSTPVCHFRGCTRQLPLATLSAHLSRHIQSLNAWQTFFCDEHLAAAEQLAAQPDQRFCHACCALETQAEIDMHPSPAHPNAVPLCMDCMTMPYVFKQCLFVGSRHANSRTQRLAALGRYAEQDEDYTNPDYIAISSGSDSDYVP
jgi:hypothetical protein